MKLFRKNRILAIPVLAAFLILAVMILPALASNDSGTENYTSVPINGPGSTFDVPVVVPGANVVVTFKVQDDGSIAAVSVAGAPSDANVRISRNEVEINYINDQKRVEVEVEATLTGPDTARIKTDIDQRPRAGTGNPSPGNVSPPPGNGSGSPNYGDHDDYDDHDDDDDYDDHDDDDDYDDHDDD